MTEQLAKLAEEAVNQMNPTRMQKLIKLGYLNNDGSNNWEFINAKLEELHPRDKEVR